LTQPKKATAATAVDKSGVASAPSATVDKEAAAEAASESGLEKPAGVEGEVTPAAQPAVPKETAAPESGSVQESKSEPQPDAESALQSDKATDGRRRPGASTALAANKARTKIKQATTAARDKIEDNVRPRVDKIRQASSVVLEEATYDPSVRFILVAGALFVLFIVLLIISKVI
jgi:hypothetical protein